MNFLRNLSNNKLSNSASPNSGSNSRKSSTSNIYGNAAGTGRALFLQDSSKRAILVQGSFKKIVRLPPYIDANEWIASNTQDFVNFISQFYGTVAEFCEGCPSMSYYTLPSSSLSLAGFTSSTGSSGGNGQPSYQLQEYMWIDSQKKSIRVSAAQYVDFVFGTCQQMLRDEAIFPTKSGSPFPKDFLVQVKQLYKHLLRILTHIYHTHFVVIVTLGLQAHLNTILAHFVCFCREFDMVEKREYAPMMELIEYFESANLI